MSVTTSSVVYRGGALALLVASCLAGSLWGQESDGSSRSLRNLLGLPPSAASVEGEQLSNDPLDELEDPLLIPADANTGTLPASRLMAPVTARYSFQDTLREQTQQQLTNFMRPMSEVSIDIREPNVRLPRDRSVELQNYVTHDWTVTNAPELAVWWAAPNIRYGQLYFENVALERYGQTCNPYKQVYASAAHFFCSVWAVPFQMWSAPAGSCDTPLGYCRPGSATDLQRQRFILWR